MSHPSSLDLEAFACGESVAGVEEHLVECAACEAFVARARTALAVGPAKPAADVLARASAIASAAAPAPAGAPSLRQAVWSRRLWNASAVVFPLALAATVLILVRTRGTSTRDGVLPPSATALVTVTVTPNGAPSEDLGTTFKGGMQVAVIRERGGAQSRFVDTVPVKAGDRLRIEVSLDREQEVEGAIQGDDASWVRMMLGEPRGRGTHFSEISVRVGDEPLRGRVLVGPVAAMKRARDEKQLEGLAQIRVEWENAP